LRKENQAARRISSELVEFNAEDSVTRQKLGDIFLRHGWYGDAYRQYATLVMDDPDDAVASLKLALAAAGMGKTDEALRLARKVAGTDGELGAVDPRPWARALSVALLARLLHEAHETGNKAMIALLEGQLKRTGMFVRQKHMRVVMWEDFELSPASTFTAEDALLTPAADVRAPQIGLRLIDLGQLIPSSVTVRLAPSQADVPMKRNVPVRLIDIHFDGDHFDVKLQKETVTNT
jgi:Ca-activated chloride channel homolog